MNNQNAKADKGKPKLSLVPTEIINCIAKVRMFGCEKYHDPDNWKGVEKDRYIDAAYRHWIKYVADNNSVDEESGLPHLWHCATNLAFLCEFDKVEREAQETQLAIQRVEAKEYQDSKHISAPPEVIMDVFKKSLVDYKPTECKECNGKACKYYDKSCMLFPNEHKETKELHEKAMKFANDNQIPELTDKSNKDTIYYNLGDTEPFVGTYSDEANGTINGYDFNCEFFYEGGTGKCSNVCSVNGKKPKEMQCDECPLWNGGQCEVKKELELCRKYDEK